MNSTTLSQKTPRNLLGDGRLHLRKELEAAVVDGVARPYSARPTPTMVICGGRGGRGWG